MKLSVANKLYEEQQRRPLTLGQPKLPSRKDQEAHFVTHIPCAPWCQACVRAEEDKRIAREEKEQSGKKSHSTGLLLHLHWRREEDG